jgi:hypothetical protein
MMTPEEKRHELLDAGWTVDKRLKMWVSPWGGVFSSDDQAWRALKHWREPAKANDHLPKR